MNILILDEISDSVIQQLEAIASVTVIQPRDGGNHGIEETIALLTKNKADILIVDATPVSAGVLEAAPWIKMVVCTRGNPVNVDSAYCKAHNIILTHAPGRNANSVAEFAIAMMINMLRNIPAAMERLKTRELCLPGRCEDLILKNRDRKDIIWRDDKLPVTPYFEFTGAEIFQKRLGLVGLGIVGRLVAEKAGALGMEVTAYDPYFKGALPPGIELVSLDDVASGSDIISLHAKDTPETAGIINNGFLSKVKKGAYLLNTARGRLIDRKALLQALDSGVLAGASLDVYDYEPLAKDDPFIDHPRILCTPHIAGASKDVIVQHSLMAYKSVSAFISKSTDIPFRYA
jgi:D-3-phosphoglycerate dehydrogenase